MKINFSYNSIVYTIIGLFPVLLITGPFLTDFFCILLGIIFITYNSQKKNWKLILDNYKIYIYFFIVFFIYLNFNSSFSFDPNISFSSSLPYIRIVLFIFSLALFLSIFKNLYKVFYLCFGLCVIFLFLDSIIQFLFNVDIFRNKEVHANRISSFFGDELIMGSYISRLLPVILGCSLLINLNNKYFLNLLILLLAGVLILLSGERLAAFYYIGIIFIYFILIKKHFFIFISVILISVFLGISFKSSFVDRFYSNTINQLKESSSIFSYRHTLHYLTAYEMFLDKKILGHGLKSFRYKCSENKYENIIDLKKEIDKKNLIKKNKDYRYVIEFKNGCNTHPHNIFLENLSELGLLGVLFIFVKFLYVTLKLIKNFYISFVNKKVNEKYLAKTIILAGIFLQLFPLVPSGSYFNNWMMIIFHLSIGFYLSLLKIR